MGDYYKYKKILVILMIVSCGFSIIRNIFKTNVQASEAVEVTPTYNDGTYTIQNDNNFDLIRQQQLDLQQQFITMIYNNYSVGNDSVKSNIRVFCRDIYNNMASRVSNRNSSRWVVFLRTTYSGDTSATFSYIIITASGISNVTFPDLILNNGYKLTNVPHFVISRGTIQKEVVVNNLDASTYNWTSGSINIPCACVGVYSEEWLNLFKWLGIISDNSVDYTNLLESIETTAEENYTQNYYTKQAVQNTYSYITNDNVDTISSTGITQPQVNEPDISDAFDSLSDLLTNDNATTKFFTFTLPNGSNHVFALSPDFLKNSLTRVGGGELVTIIETLWYIGLYGLMIFTGLKIIGALLSGDLDAVTGVLSPVNSVVNSSLEVTGAFRTSGGSESAFRIRKG